MTFAAPNKSDKTSRETLRYVQHWWPRAKPRTRIYLGELSGALNWLQHWAINQHKSEIYVCQPFQDLSSKQLRCCLVLLSCAGSLGQTTKQSSKRTKEQINKRTVRQTKNETQTNVARSWNASQTTFHGYPIAEVEVMPEAGLGGSRLNATLTNYIRFWWAQENFLARSLRPEAGAGCKRSLLRHP